MNIWSRFMSGARGFKKEWFSAGDTAWESHSYRLGRYAIFQGFYDSDVYDSIHSYASILKAQFGLYTSTRAIASPASTIVAHFRDHVWAGALDPTAGDTGAVPIYTEIESLRPIIANIWKWSQWAKNKNLLVTKGTIFGDIGIRIIDDISRNKIYLEILDPALVKQVELDPFNNVKSYVLEYEVEHPEKPTTLVTYKEEVTKDGNTITYKTYMNDKPYAYPTNIDRTGTLREKWEEEYGFIPMVWIAHIDVGETYGQSELFAGLSKFREIDDISSLLSDQIRKTVRPWWHAIGIKKGDDLVFPEITSTSDRPEPNRELDSIVYSKNPNAKLEAKIVELDIEGTIEHIRQLEQGLKKEYPELVIHDQQVEQGMLSGRALRLARQPAEARIIERRNNYDTGLKSALQMAMSIGGMRGIYPGITLESYEQGNLDFNISQRPVYIIDPEDKADIDQKFAEAAKTIFEAGIDLKGWLQLQGMTEEEIKLLAPSVVPEKTSITGGNNE